MVIHGLQKMTLLDFPGKVACTVFLGGCDFRCPFCHNADILDMNAPGEVSEDAFFSFLKGRMGLLDGVAITGGEPLLRKDIAPFFEKIKSMGYLIKLDTNGNNPESLINLVQSGLVDYVAVDVKNSKERYAETIGLPEFNTEKVDKTIRFLIESNIDYEFRTTVVKELHDADSFVGIGKWIEGASKYYIQGFVDRDTVPFEGLHSYEKDELESFAKIIKPYVEEVHIRGL